MRSTDVGALLIGGFITLMVWGQFDETAAVMTGVGIAWVGAIVRWHHR